MPSAWNVWPRIARSSEISSVARSSSGSDSRIASIDEPSARAIDWSSVSLGSRRPFSIIDSWLGARSTAAASSSRVMPRSVRSCRMRRPMVRGSTSSSSGTSPRNSGVNVVVMGRFCHENRNLRKLHTSNRRVRPPNFTAEWCHDIPTVDPERGSRDAPTRPTRRVRASLHHQHTRSQEDRDMTPATATPMRTRTGPIPTQIHEPSIEIAGRMQPRYDEVLTPEAIAFLTELHQRFGARRHDRLADRMRRRFEIGNGHDPQFRDDTRAHPRGCRVDGRRRRSRPRGPPRRDHGPDRPEDDDQRAQLRREGVARRPGGRHQPHLEERHRGSAEPARRDPRRALVHQPRGQALRGHGRPRPRPS